MELSNLVTIVSVASSPRPGHVQGHAFWHLTFSTASPLTETHNKRPIHLFRFLLGALTFHYISSGTWARVQGQGHLLGEGHLLCAKVINLCRQGLKWSGV